jgi:hypothetical protein
MENLTEFYFKFWLSKVILKCANPQEKACFRQIEKINNKIINTEQHRKFNEQYIQGVHKLSLQLQKIAKKSPIAIF